MALAAGTFARSECQRGSDNMQWTSKFADVRITGASSGCEVRHGSILH